MTEKVLEDDEQWNRFADRFTVSGCDVLLDGKKFASAESVEAARFSAGALSYTMGHDFDLMEYAKQRS